MHIHMGLEVHKEDAQGRRLEETPLFVRALDCSNDRASEVHVRTDMFVRHKEHNKIFALEDQRHARSV